MLVGGRDRATAIPDPHTAGIPMRCSRSCTGARTRGGVFEFKDELFADPRLRRLVAQPGGLLFTGSEGSDVRCLRCSGRFQNVVLLAHFSFLHRPPAAIPRIALLLTHTGSACRLFFGQSRRLFFAPSAEEPVPHLLVLSHPRPRGLELTPEAVLARAR